jgi:hypothetical protein
MPRKRKNETRDAEILAPVPIEVLDQFVREGPLTAAEVEAATRRFKKAIIERPSAPSSVTTSATRPARQSLTPRPIIATGPAARPC